MTFRERAEAELQKLENEIRYYERLIKRGPPGSLRCHKNGTGYKWFRAEYDEKGKEERFYIPKSKEDYAKRLALKTLYKKQLVNLKQRAEPIRRYLKETAKFSDKTLIWNDLPPGFQNLLYGGELLTDPAETGSDKQLETKIQPFAPGSDEDLRQWQKEPYKRNPNHPETLTVKAVKGLMVRSKSEAFIAAALTQYGVPFRYEDEFEAGQIVYYPDFTIRHPVNGAVFIWEHFGMLENNIYLENAFSKIRMFLKSGFIPFDNLILTFETAERPLSFSLVENLIRHYFFDES